MLGFLCGKSDDLQLIVCVQKPLAALPTKAVDSVCSKQTRQLMCSANPYDQSVGHVRGLRFFAPLQEAFPVSLMSGLLSAELPRQSHRWPRLGK